MPGQKDWARRGWVCWLQHAPLTACRPLLQTLFTEQKLPQRIMEFVVFSALGSHWHMTCVSQPSGITSAEPRGEPGSATSVAYLKCWPWIGVVSLCCTRGLSRKHSRQFLLIKSEDWVDLAAEPRGEIKVDNLPQSPLPTGGAESPIFLEGRTVQRNLASLPPSYQTVCWWGAKIKNPVSS